MSLQFASVSTKKGAPSFRVVCERVGTTTLGCHPAPERSAQWMDLQFASVSTKKGCPILSRTCERVGTTTQRCHPEPEAKRSGRICFFACTVDADSIHHKS